MTFSDNDLTIRLNSKVIFSFKDAIDKLEIPSAVKRFRGHKPARKVWQGHRFPGSIHTRFLLTEFSELTRAIQTRRTNYSALLSLSIQKYHVFSFVWVCGQTQSPFHPKMDPKLTTNSRKDAKEIETISNIKRPLQEIGLQGMQIAIVHSDPCGDYWRISID